MSQPETGTTCDICNQWYPEGYEWYSFTDEDVKEVKNRVRIDHKDLFEKAEKYGVDIDEIMASGWNGGPLPICMDCVPEEHIKYNKNKKGGNNDERNIV